MDAFIFACTRLQGDRHYRGKFPEDDRNTQIATLLDASGYNTKDQRRWSKSAAGKFSGEIDIFVNDKKGLPFIIIEALNLSYLDKEYTKKHWNKIFKYDTTGLKNNIVLVYSTAKSFLALCSKYFLLIPNHKFPYQFISCEELDHYPYTDIKMGKSIHLRNGSEIFLYHIIVNLYDPTDIVIKNDR
jgi:hypothetical protein